MQETQIPEEHYKYGCIHRLIERRGRVVIYRLTNMSEELRGFEVVIVQRKEPGLLFGKFQPGGECLPSTSHWGVFGWSYSASGEQACRERFERACKHFNPRKLVRRR